MNIILILVGLLLSQVSYGQDKIPYSCPASKVKSAQDCFNKALVDLKKQLCVIQTSAKITDCGLYHSAVTKYESWDCDIPTLNCTVAPVSVDDVLGNKKAKCKKGYVNKVVKDQQHPGLHAELQVCVNLLASGFPSTQPVPTEVLEAH